MGLLDVFQKGGKYFGKDIKPHCEYCEFGKRAKDGNKVLCDKRGLVDAEFSCGKFTYSPLKRIPVKQLNRVGFTDVDDEFLDNEDETVVEESAAKTVAPLELPEEKPVAPAPVEEVPAPAPAPVAEEPAPAPAPAPVAEEAAPAPVPVAEEPAPAPVSVAPMDEIAPAPVPMPEPVAAPVVEEPAAMDARTAEQLAADQAAEEALRALESLGR